MEISLILAAGRDGSIGKEGNLIWHISEDLKRFKALTRGHTVVMGRKTWESLPRRPLPDRKNIVMTRNSGYVAEGSMIMSEAEVRELLQSEGNEKIFIIGGGEIYRLLMPFADTLHLTLIDAGCPEADTFLEIDPLGWSVTHEEGPFLSPEGMSYRFQTLKRRNQ